MVDGRLIRRCPAEYRRLPSVQVAVKMDDGDGAVCAVDGPQERKDDRVVAPQCDDPWMVFPIRRDGHEREARKCVVAECREWGAVKELLVPVLNLLDGEFVVVGRDGNVAAVDDLEPGAEGVHVERHVVPPVEGKTTRAGTDARRAEPGPRAVGRAGVLLGEFQCHAVRGCWCVPYVELGGEGERLTKGAPTKATSKGSALSFPRHCTQGSLAKVVMPEKIELAVTGEKDDAR